MYVFAFSTNRALLEFTFFKFPPLVGEDVYDSSYSNYLEGKAKVVSNIKLVKTEQVCSPKKIFIGGKSFGGGGYPFENHPFAKCYANRHGRRLVKPLHGLFI